MSPWQTITRDLHSATSDALWAARQAMHGQRGADDALAHIAKVRAALDRAEAELKRLNVEAGS